MNAKGLKTISQFYSKKGHQRNDTYRHFLLRLHQINETSYWQVAEDCGDNYYQETLSKIPFAECTENYVMYTFNDKLFPSTLSPFIGGGVIGLYSTYILLASNFFRHLFSGKSSSIMRKDLPYVDRILQLCLDIYLAREQKDFKLEEDLYGKLVFLYRSSETMIRWTRAPDAQMLNDDSSDIDETEAEKTFRKNANRRLI